MKSLENKQDRPLPDQELVKLILANVAEGVFTVDNRFRITFFNPAAEQITGFSSNEAIGRYCHEVFRASSCKGDCPLRQSLRTGKTVKNFEIDILTSAHKKATISVCTAPLIDQSGNFLGGVETFRDMSTIKELQKEISGKYTFQDIISKNSRMQQIFKTLPNIAQSDAAVLIQGRSGTGKELFATAIHNLSPRAEGPLVTVNCGALPETLLESELFGYVKGAFTDARQNRTGRFQAADGGTIFLDEIGDTPMSMQVKLLRVLEHHEVQPLGSDKTEKFDVRVVAATNQSLEKLVAEGRFREDLYYRLNVILIQLPNLSERSEDIPLLVGHFIERFNQRTGRSLKGVSDKALAALMRYSYPGNVRELENILEHAYTICARSTISLDELPDHVIRGQVRPEIAAATGNGIGSALSERQRIEDCLERNNWSITRTARELGMHRTTLWRKVKKYNIARP